MRILVSLLIAVFVFVGAFAQDEGETIDNCAENFYCTEDFCTSTCAPICPLPENDECEGLVMQLYETDNDFCNCCPGRCVVYLAEGDACDPSPTSPTEMCGPRLSCQTPDGEFTPRCMRANTKCLNELTAYQAGLANGSLGINQSPPVCDDDGYYSPVQCYRGGLCRCVEKESGDPIFGTTGSLTEAIDSEQNCQCARHFQDSLVQGCKMTTSYKGDEVLFQDEVNECVETAMKASFQDTNYFPGFMRCLPNGNFDTVQCVTSYVTEDLCFCMSDGFNVTGGLVYQSTTSDLECYDEDIHYPAYFRPCEAELHHQDVMSAQYSSLGDSREFYFGSDGPRCTVDGWYDKVQHSRENITHLYCSDSEGNQLEEFSATLFEADGDAMDCECAWTRKYLPNGVPKPTCCDNGNFKGIQCQGGFCFCVDKFGRQIGKEVDQLDIDQLQDCEDHCLPPA